MLLLKTDSYSKFILTAIFCIMTVFLLLSGAMVPGASLIKVPTFLMILLLFYSLVSGKFNELTKTVITPLMISVSAYLVIYIVSLFYASTGQFALTVFSYYAGGVALFFLTVLLVNRQSANGRYLLGIMASSIAVSGIFSIDAASTRILTRGLEWLVASLFKLDVVTIGGFEAGTRMISVVGNPNVFGSLAALGTLASCYLFLSSTDKKERFFIVTLLSVNYVSMLYCFSLGSLLSMFFAIIVLFLAAGKEARPKVVYVTLATILTAFLSVGFGFLGMGKTGPITILPLAALIFSTILLYWMLRFADGVAEKVATMDRKKIFIILITLLFIIMLVLGSALTLSKPYTFSSADAPIKRAVTLEPGSYQLEIQSTGSPLSRILIESQSYQQASTQTSTVLFDSTDLSQPIDFKVPIDSEICFLYVYSEPVAVITGINVLDQTGTKIETIKPGYLLLPDFMANRLQGIFVNENAAQRLVFFQDGMKIAAMNPIIGLGPGAFESNVLTVQNYYYVTTTPHNHYIQTLDETGIIGLIAFLLIFVLSFIALFKKRKNDESRALYCVLFSMLAMIITHTMIEVTFAHGIYNMCVYLILGLVSGVYGQVTLTEKEKKKAVILPTYSKVGALSICLLLLIIYTGQFAAMQLVNKAGKSGDLVTFLNTLKSGMILDFSNDVSYKTSYINAYQAGLPEEYLLTSLNYAKDLEKHSSFGTMTELVNYYLKIGQNEDAYRCLNTRITLMRYDEKAWNETFDLYRAHLSEMIQLQDQAGIQLLQQYTVAASALLDDYLKESPLGINLSGENKEFISSLK